MLKKITAATVGLFCVLGTLVSAQAKQTETPLEVVTTLFSAYDFAKQIGQDKVRITLLLPPGVEAHTFEPKPSDIVRISKSDVFVYIGKFMEPWLDDILTGLSHKKLVVVDASNDIKLIKDEDQDEERDMHGGVGKHHSGGHEHGHHLRHGKDPHIWLDPVNAQKMVDNIAEGFCKQDAIHCDFYKTNAAEYKKKLHDLDHLFRTGLAHCKQRTILYGGHFAFAYFAHRYSLKFVSPYRGFSPDAEPTPRAIAELIQTIRSSGMKCIFYEELLDPKVARTISKETGAKIELLHGAHNVSKQDLTKGLTYLDIMEENLVKLKTGLECS